VDRIRRSGDRIPRSFPSAHLQEASPTAVSEAGGLDAMQLRVAEQYVTRFDALAKEANTLVVPANLSDAASMLELATNIVKDGKSGRAAGLSPTV